MNGAPARALRSPAVRAMAWMLASGFLFVLLNAVLRMLAQQLDPMVAQFLRNAAGAAVMLPFILRAGLAAYRPRRLGGQVWRGLVHTTGLVLWFLAVPHVTLAEITALGFTTPLFIMLGAAIFLGERMVAARWAAALAGFGGVLIVVAPALAAGGAGGTHPGFPWALVLLLASPVFAASSLITKALTRHDSPQVIVLWQSLMVAIFSLPLALWHWQWPTAEQWAWVALSGLLGSAGHYCLTRAFGLAELSVTQPVKFLELAWAVLLGLAIWGEAPGVATLVGGAVIFAATSWIARREARGRG